jgi:DeoR/GlpR family transcriptional regulator of sugar metabolism
VLYGGTLVSGWRPDGDRFWSADLPGVKEGTYDFRALVVNDRLAERARLPETGTFQHLSVFPVRWLSSVGGGWERAPRPEELTTMLYDPKDLPATLDVKNAEVRVYHMWDESMVGVSTNDTQRHALLFSRPAIIEFAFQERNKVQMAEKQAIARTVAKMIKPGMSVFLDTGTTTLEVAKEIAGTPQLRGSTCSLTIAAALYARDNIDLILLGGQVRRNSPDLFSPLTEDNLTQFHPQLAILGADAADRDGFFTMDLAVARLSRVTIAHAERSIVALDSSKFTQHSFVRIAGWEQIHGVVTDARLPREAHEWLAKAVREVHLAPAP